MPRVKRSGTACQQSPTAAVRNAPTRADKVTAFPLTKIVEDAVTVGLKHLGVNVIARVAELSDLLRQKLHARCGIAKNDRLVDLELEEQTCQRY